ncbi:MAG: glycosyltransferase [Phycisphaerales bacterium]|nr:MAG: glycosyltransferase [Phycisphaerales bacterium]
MGERSSKLGVAPQPDGGEKTPRPGATDLGVDLKSHGVDGVICFGSQDWWYHNRGHIDMQLMRRYAQSVTTIYVNSIVMQKPKLGAKSDFMAKVARKAKSILNGLKATDVGFWAYSPFSMPVHHIDWLRPLNRACLNGQLKLVLHKLGVKHPIVWVACPAACEVALKMKKAALVYQRTDRFEEFPNVEREVIKRYDTTMKAAADLTLFVNRPLFDEEQHECKQALYLDHGVDYDLFAGAAEDPTVPEDIVDIPKPIIGFHGSFGKHTTDFGLIRKVAELVPEYMFVFVGPKVPECESLETTRNIKMLGQRDYEVIPHYAKHFDVTIMPWCQNRWIEACNPIKLKECLALGKPIVSTPFPELQKYRELVYQAATPEAFAEAIRTALAEDNAERISARRKAVESASWDRKARIVLGELFGERES